MKEPHLFARAAKLLEERPSWDYPCFAILAETGRWPTDYAADPDCRRFMAVFSATRDGHGRSKEFCDALMQEETVAEDIDNAVLALCFAAAIEEAGDHPDGPETTNG